MRAALTWISSAASIQPRWIPWFLVGLTFFTAFTWTSWKMSQMRPRTTPGMPLRDLTFPEQYSSNYTEENLRNICVCPEYKMNYAQPATLTQSRTDVLTLTPWFAPIVWEGTYNLDILNEQFKRMNVSIGLTVFAIKKYTVFLQHFIETAEKFFMVGHKVNYYVLTDQPDQVPEFTLASGRRLVIIKVSGYKRWQEVSMRRMEMIHNASRETFINEVDYIVSVDVDMEFTDLVGVEILSERFGTLHPGFYRGQRPDFTYERRPQSEACIPGDEGDFYYAGGFFGGSVREVNQLTRQCHKAMMRDKERGIEAIWHDESYLNKYFLYHKPTKILSPEYLWDNGIGSPAVLKKKRFMAVKKNHAAIRNK
ncbi:histo-blood group ABO system transferase-like isoform X2 [Lissotriton helveticus]